MPNDSIHIGTAGWSYEDWKGIVYPPDMPGTTHPLELLSQWFDVVEVNSTFYRPPSARNCASWVEKVADKPRFAFTVKLWQRFTHERGSFPTDAEVRTYCDGIQPLVEAGRLGAILVQFPWSFKRTDANRRWLAAVMDAFADYPLALEIRHSSWNRPEVFEGLAERQAAFCNIDQPLFRDSIAPSDKVTARVGYVRLHGRNAQDWFREDASRDERYDYLYSAEELSPWIEKIRAMRQRVNELFVITNNHYRGQAVVNALELGHALGGRKYALPKHLVDEYPRLRELLMPRDTP
ncbi:MAG: DUF72 domain-containing protein [Candidatus Hydrogenedentes bacterium]|nr:DUF72 domain-containing protein [Candidatus Hydrogenedentota bacterium]